MMLGAEAPRPDSYVDLGYQYPRPKHKSGALSPHGTPTTLCALVFLPLVCAMLLSCQISNSLMSEMVLKICDVSECYWIFVASVVTYILVAAVSICYFVAKEEVKQMPMIKPIEWNLNYKINTFPISSWTNTGIYVGICELHKNTMDIIASSVKKAVNLIHSDSLSDHRRDQNNSSEKKSSRPPSIVLSSSSKRRTRKSETYTHKNILKTDDFYVYSMMVNTMHRKHTRKKKKCNKQIKLTKCISDSSSESSPRKETSSYDVDNSQRSNSSTIDSSETKSLSDGTSNVTGKISKELSNSTLLWGSICRRPGIFESSSESKLDTLNSSSSIISLGNRKTKKKKKHKRFSSSESFDTVSFEEEMSYESIFSSGSYASTDPGTMQEESEPDTSSEYDTANETNTLEIYTSQTSVNEKNDSDDTPEESSTPNTEVESSEIRSSSSFDLTNTCSSTVSSTDSQKRSFFRFDKRFSFPWQRNKKEDAIYSTHIKKSKFKYGTGKSKRNKQVESSTVEEETEETVSIESKSSVDTLIQSTSSNDTITEECNWTKGLKYDKRITTLWHRRYKSGERVAKSIVDNYMPLKPRLKGRNELFDKKEKRDPVPLGESQEIVSICKWSSNSKDYSDRRDNKVKKLCRKRPKKRETIYAAYVNTKHCAYNPKKIRKGKVVVKSKRKVPTTATSNEPSVQIAKNQQMSNAVSKLSINTMRNQKLADFMKLDCLSTMPWRRKKEETVQILRIIKDGNAERSKALEKLRAEREAALKRTIMGNRTKNITKFW
ncbi:uncharacterized protein LOC119694594 [Plutella xylostella]|uniref:uncharacterized protein LOC119694594 n=1 Tax=Plutella xylostella TaxID=51655 RepID=UPI0020329FC2|nr:uncharacterized protein LOC119694594 [Plutella xylostella]